MAERLDKHHCEISSILIVVRGLRHESGRLVFLQLSQGLTSTKISRIAATFKIYLYERKSRAAQSLLLFLLLLSHADGRNPCPLPGLPVCVCRIYFRKSVHRKSMFLKGCEG